MEIEVISDDLSVPTNANMRHKKNEAEGSPQYAYLQSALEHQTSVILLYKLPQGKTQKVARRVVNKMEDGDDFVFHLEP